MSSLSKDDIELRNKITQRLIDLRESTGLNQSDFAKLHDIDRQQVNRWESFESERGVTIYTIKRFCRLLKITLQEFFNDPLFK
ncbi:helix-turn-helix transcriptional regulator [Chryseobacterium lathyri]|uniref:Transcriptional regulator with XRE-family HTH domain n=1 Tax=Chryseobacterium lathyri TaxID=395933 RepID=A0ABT9SRE8_9FLAO|nr:helix-turn-helix transcriptional regulator [Chryseobacterium lathyri]MDP9962009.1 transcriptional regulator with XRE-family HTH domain [Chryseobacterium lathyri]